MSCLLYTSKAYTKVDEELLEDLEEVLITADVGVNTTMDIIEKLEDVIRTKKITDQQDVREELKLIIEDILSKDDTKLDEMCIRDRTTTNALLWKSE